MMHRREFITILGVATAAAPLAARAQQPAAMPVIGFLHLATSDAITDRLRAFQRGLKETGFVEGDNVTIAYRFAEGRTDRLPDLAADLVRRRVNVIVAPASNEVASAAIAATRTIPILFVVGEDPVRLGYVKSIARPGGNATGVNFFNAELNAKRLDLLHQMVPSARRIALLNRPASASVTAIRDLEAAAPAMGLQIQEVNASSGSEIDAAFAQFERERPDALYVDGSSVFNSRRLQLSLLAMRAMLPASYSSRDYPEYGGLMSYGTDVGDAFHQVGVYAARILKGAKPADLPVIQATKFELAINLITAKALGLTVPPSLLAIADVVIE
jgi:putative ABC transport system substrate-binding protein